MGRNAGIEIANPCAGFTLVETLVTLAVSSIVLLVATTQYVTTISHANDHQTRLEALVQAQAMAQTMVSELRMAGNGVPFDQANFEIGENTLPDPTVTEPIVTATSSESTIDFRLNESGEVYVLRSIFDPGSSLTMLLNTTAGLNAGDTVYISNSVMSGDDGLKGTIAGVNSGAGSITLTAGYVATAGATFIVGSTLEKVNTIRYANSDGNITRDAGSSPVVLGTNSTASFEYLDFNGVPVSPPLTPAQLVDVVRSIRVTIVKQSAKKLSNGEFYSAGVSQTVGIRNLNLFF